MRWNREWMAHPGIAAVRHVCRSGKIAPYLIIDRAIARADIFQLTVMAYTARAASSGTCALMAPAPLSPLQ